MGLSWGHGRESNPGEERERAEWESRGENAWCSVQGGEEEGKKENGMREE